MSENYFLGSDLTPEQEKAVEQASKLFRVAGRSPDEAALYIAKAQEILAAHSLDMAILEQGGADKGRRVEEALKGGFFKYQRDLWESVAELNFCYYWSQVTVEKIKKWLPNGRGGFKRAYDYKRHHEHRIVGRQINAKLSITMAQYLEQAIERALRERMEVEREDYKGKWATSFREGAAEAIVGKLAERRSEILSEERKKQREAQAKAHAAGMDSASTGTGITLVDVAKQEQEANLDHIYGEGWCAKQAKRRAEARAMQAAAEKEAEEAYTRWAEAHPEEAKKQADEARKRERRNAARRDRYRRENGYSYRPPPAYKGDYSAFKAGHAAGQKIGIDPQAHGSRATGTLG